MRSLLRNLFIPHEGNDFHPHLLQRVSIGAMVFLVLLSFMTANIQALIWVNVDWLVGAVLPAVVIEKTNKERSSDGLGLLNRNSTLEIAAQLKAEDMAKNSYFAHYSPTGVSPWYWFNQAGYSFIFAGENLAVHFSDSKEVVKAWMQSPTHRANIMNGTYTEIGIGVAQGKYEGYDTVFVVQLFGTPSLIPTASSEVASAEVEEVVDTIPVRSSASLSEVAGVSESEPKEAVPEETPVEAPPVEIVDFVAVLESSKPLTLEASAEEVAQVERTAEAPAATATEESVLATETLTTSTVPASIEERPVLDKAPWYAFVTQPLVVLQLIYLAVASFVLVILLISLWIEWRRHHPLQLVYSGGLMAAMVGLFYVHSLIVGGAVLV